MGTVFLVSDVTCLSKWQACYLFIPVHWVSSFFVLNANPLFHKSSFAHLFSFHDIIELQVLSVCRSTTWKVCVQFSLPIAEMLSLFPDESLLFRVNVVFNPTIRAVIQPKLHKPETFVILIQLTKKLLPCVEPEGLWPSQDPVPSSPALN
jgi:hypothetical protein